MNFEIKYKKINENAKEPIRATPHSAGFDLFCVEELLIKPETQLLINTGIIIEIPEGYFGYIMPKSGLAIKLIDTRAGVIDSDFRGEIKVLLRNESKEYTHIFKKNEKIAQIVFIKYLSNAIFKEVSELNETKRGEGGFGSTGK